jgi:3D (Asp-Asp-Asp) domain-containing protein
MKGISQSLWRKMLVTLVAGVGFVLLYQVTILDSRYAARQAMQREEVAEPGPGARLRFVATAYCKGTITASGLPPRTGIAAADPRVLPVGSVVQVLAGAPRYHGIYTVMDTGLIVNGRRIDIYTRDCNEAVRFGRRTVQLFVLRMGWNPAATGPSILDKLIPWK